jgi:hypothetical protein
MEGLREVARYLYLIMGHPTRWTRTDPSEKI